MPQLPAFRYNHHAADAAQLVAADDKPDGLGEVLEALKMLAEERLTMICGTHEMAFARDVSNRLA